MGRPAVDRNVVLLVEDELLQRRHLEEVLTEAGFIVVTASRVESALGVLDKREDISAVVTDIRMPGALDGFVVAWRARKEPRPLPVIVVSAFVQAGHEEPAMGFRYLAKPVTPAVLVNEVKKAIAGAATRKAP